MTASKFGPQDQLGNLNHVTPEKTLAATRLVTKGKAPRNGIHILESINTEEMVRDQAWEFLFTLGPARITGSVQAIVNLIAIK